MTETERNHLIESLCFLSGKPDWWFKDMRDEDLLDMYDKLSNIY